MAWEEIYWCFLSSRSRFLTFSARGYGKKWWEIWRKRMREELSEESPAVGEGRSGSQWVALSLGFSCSEIFNQETWEALWAARVGGQPTTHPPLSHFIFLLSLSFSKEFFNVISNLILKTSLLLVGRVGMHGELDWEASFFWSRCQRLKEWAALLERVLTFGHKMAAFSQPTLLSQPSPKWKTKPWSSRFSFNFFIDWLY